MEIAPFLGFCNSSLFMERPFIMTVLPLQDFCEKSMSCWEAMRHEGIYGTSWLNRKEKLASLR